MKQVLTLQYLAKKKTANLLHFNLLHLIVGKILERHLLRHGWCFLCRKLKIMLNLLINENNFLGVPGEPVPLTSEEDIFDVIEFPYKKPEEREN